MKGVASRNLPGLILGWVIVFEGFFALSIAGRATIDGIGTIMPDTFRLASMQLIALGVFISVAWTLKTAFPDLKGPVHVRVFNGLAYMAMLLLAVEGLAIVAMAGDVRVSGFGGVGKRWIVLVGAQLFAVAALSLRLWRLRDVKPLNWLADLMGSVVATILMLEGLTAIGIAGTTTIEGYGTLLERTVLYAGSGLFALGLISFSLWTLTQDPWLGERLVRYLKPRWSMLMMLVLGSVIMGAAVAMSFFAGTVTVEGASGAYKIYVVAGIAQLFLLGLATPVLWRLSERPLDRGGFTDIVAVASLAILAFEGVFAMGLAANTEIEGIGGILQSTFRLAGAQLLLLSLTGITTLLIRESLQRRMWASRVVSILFMVPVCLIALEGLAAIVLAADLRIDDFSSVRERYVVLGGVQMTALAIISLISWTRGTGLPSKFKLAGIAGAAFMLLMIPIAIMV